jgi:hypothetical protein
VNKAKSKPQPVLTADELIAKELRRAIRRQAKVAQEIEATTATIRRLDNEQKGNERAIKDLRSKLGEGWDAEGNRIEE